MAWNSSLHPRVPSGAGGGQFTTGGSKGSAKAAPAGKKTAPKPAAKKESLASIAKKRAAGKKLTPAELHQWHLAHVAHVSHVAAVKARTAAKKPAAKTTAKAAPKPMTSGQKTKAMQMARSGR